jgi:hypothetical protein
MPKLSQLSSPGLTRRSRNCLPKGLDCRVKPDNDSEGRTRHSPLDMGFSNRGAGGKLFLIVCRDQGSLRSRRGAAAAWRRSGRATRGLSRRAHRPSPHVSGSPAPRRPGRDDRVEALSFSAPRRPPQLAVVQRKSVLSIHMRCRMTAILRASATLAFLRPMRLASLTAQALRAHQRLTRLSSTVAASNR